MRFAGRRYCTRDLLDDRSLTYVRTQPGALPPPEIPFGLRRYPLMLGVFGGLGLGMIAWSRGIDRPTFVFPLGMLDPAEARLALVAVGIAALLYIAFTSHVRFVRRPTVLLRDDEVTLPQGEFGLTAVTLRAGDVLSVREGPARAGGWRSCYVRHRGGMAVVRSSQVPSDEAFDEICKRLDSLSRDRQTP